MKGEHLKLDIFREKVIRELGEALPKLPKGWNWITLGDERYFKRYGGGTPKKSVEKYWKNGTMPWVTNSEIPEGKVVVITATQQKITELALRHSSATVVPKGSVILGCTASIGKVAIAGVELTTNQQFNSFKCNEEQVLPQFVAYYFLTQKASLQMIAGETTFKHIVIPKLLKFRIPLPPLDEQKRIATRIEEILSRVEQAKKLREEALKDAEAIMQSALYEVFLRAEERGWEWKNLTQVCKIDCESRNPSVAAPNEEFAYIDISGIESGTGKIREVKKILGKDAPSRARRVIHTNDVIMSTVRPYLKSFAIIPEEYDNQMCSTGFAVLSCGQSMLPKYLLYGLFWDGVIDQCNKMMIGAHYPALNSRQVAEIRIPVAFIAEQRSIITCLDRLQEKVEMLKQTQSKTKEELEAIIPTVLDRAFRGEL